MLHTTLVASSSFTFERRQTMLLGWPLCAIFNDSVDSDCWDQK
jgi:hypothetical protein